MAMQNLREAVSSVLQRLRKQPPGGDRLEPSEYEAENEADGAAASAEAAGSDDLASKLGLRERVTELRGRFETWRELRASEGAAKRSDGPGVPLESPDAPKKRARHGGGDILRVLLVLDNNREVVCHLHPDGTVERENNPEPGETYLMFSSQDMRYRSKPLSHTKALSLALENQGQAVRLVNRSSDLGAFYTRAQDAMAEYDIVPGGQAVDLLLKKHKVAAEFPRVAGVSLGDEASGATVVVLFYYDADGEVGRPQISINPQSLEFALTQFATTRKFDVESIPRDIYTYADLREVFRKCQPYLNEDLYGGRTKGAWLQSAVAFAGVAVLGSFGATGYYYTAVDAAETTAAEATAQAARLTSERRKLLMDSTQSLGAAYALDPTAVLAGAESIWRPGFAITVDTDREGNVVLLASATLPREMAPEAKASVLKDLAALPAPPGCVSDNLLIAGGLSEAKTSFKCARKTNAPDAYRPR